MRKYLPLLLAAVLLFAGCSRPGEAESVVRLHIIANSDSQEDQAVKLKVRDSVLAYMRSINSPKNKEEALAVIKDSTQVFKEIADGVLKQENFEYEASAEVGCFTFPAKQYGSAWYPAGEYDALKVTLGDGKGKNWWCVMFPPLCLMDVSFADKQELEQIGSQALLLEDMPSITYKSQIWEWLKGLFGDRTAVK